MPDEITLRPSLVSEALDYCWRARKMPFIHGAPGTSKSSLVAQAAEARGLPLFDVRAAQLDPVDLRGLPTVVNGVTRWARPEFLPTTAAILFFDEVNRAVVLVQNSCFQLFLDRRLGDYVLPDTVHMVAAGNRESDGGGVMRMPSALSNRLVHITLEPHHEDWCDWAWKHDIDESVIAFIKSYPQKLLDFNRDAPAWPSPRSWSFVSDIIKHEPNFEVERALIAGSVGHGAAVEFIGYLQHYRNTTVTVDEILADPENATVPEDASALYAVTYAVSFRLTPENFGRGLIYLNRLPVEHNIFAVKDAGNRDPQITRTKEYAEWGVNHIDVLGSGVDA